MIFNLDLKVINEAKKINKSSALVSFFINTKEIKKDVEIFINRYSLSINDLLVGKIIKEKEYSTEINNSQNPELIFLKKIDIDKNFTSDFFRNYFAGVIQNLEDKGIKELYIEIPNCAEFNPIFNSKEHFYQSIIEGIYLGNYTFNKYKSEKKKITNLAINLIDSIDNVLLQKVISKVSVISQAVYFARDLVNEPAITLTPDELEKRVKYEFKNKDVTVKVLNKSQLQKKKMNAILAVGNASSYDPRLISLHYKPSKKAKKKIVLVGKGVTYDSGGLSIKPTSGMLEMKGDMGGAATVIGVIKAAAKLKLNVELIGLIPTVENMLSGNSYKPGDVITSYSGKTIEVKDTDAEGRIILADALTYANEFKPDEIIDFATLTGAVVVALGEDTAGLMTQSKDIEELMLNSSNTSGERLWPLPFDNSYKKQLESDIADISNLGSRWGGAITAGKFLEFFVDEKTPWAHIDLAGPALKHEATNYSKKYDTGFGVRLMIEYLMNAD